MYIYNSDRKIDMRGKKITTYIIYYAVCELKTMNTDQVLEIATEKYTHIENDIKAWCQSTGHFVTNLENQTDYSLYYIKKGKANPEKRKFAINISSEGLEDLISPLAIALGAALEGKEVYMIFQGPAVKVLEEGYKGKLSGFAHLFSGIARKKMAEIGHIPPQEKIIQLKELGAQFYICPVSMEVFKVKESDLIFNDIVYATYFTFLSVMTKSDTMIYLQ